MKSSRFFLIAIWGCFLIASCSIDKYFELQKWTLIDDFESGYLSEQWVHLDLQNETDPFLDNPQIHDVVSEEGGNSFLLRKPAVDGVVGNRKAIGFYPLPHPVEVGETYTFYTRINVEAFPNNHSFGLSNLTSEEISTQNYDAFEPMLRITDKVESDGSKNDGSLMVLKGDKQYSKVRNPLLREAAKPLVAGQWYEIWYIVNNGPQKDGGQTYSVYMRGGEFVEITQVYSDAKFRMGRTRPLLHFMTISNTGPKQAPYGNGGVRYDDIYMIKGEVVTSPKVHIQ